MYIYVHFDSLLRAQLCLNNVPSVLCEWHAEFYMLRTHAPHFSVSSIASKSIAGWGKIRKGVEVYIGFSNGPLYIVDMVYFMSFSNDM